jgi:hypothetical protein
MNDFQISKAEERTPKAKFTANFLKPRRNAKKKIIKSLLVRSFWKSRNLFSKRFLAAGGKVYGGLRKGLTSVSQ